MAMVPLSYNFRSLFVRWGATLLTMVGIGATVAVLAGVLALRQGFVTVFEESGRDDLFVFLRPGATNESDSLFERDRAQTLMKSRPEIAVDANQQPIAAMECFLAVRRFRSTGGETNVAVRGVQPMSFELNKDVVRMSEGRRFTFGSDEVIVGRRLVGNFRDCSLGDVIVFNTVPMKVVGVFDGEGPFASEIWGDLERISDALERSQFNRVIARLKPGTDIAAMKLSIEKDAQIPAQMVSEREMREKQTEMFSGVLLGLSIFLAVIMGIAAVFTATNTMLSAIAARAHEIGILLSIGFRPGAIFASFLFETLLLTLLGGLIGCLLVQPLSGVETRTSNFTTFTDVSFAFQVSTPVLLSAIAFSVVLGLVGGAWPALRASRLRPTEALRRH